MARLFVDNTMRVSLENLRRANGEAVNDAICTASLQDSGGTDVPGSLITLTYAAGSQGDYSGLLPASLALTTGSDYKLVVTATTPDQVELTCSTVFEAEERSCFAGC